MRPQEFKHAYVVMQNAAYQLVEQDGTTSSFKTGLLDAGKRVWLPDADRVEQLGQSRVLGYAESIGTIAISRNALASAT